ncbi:MAG: hypothetical protein LBC60_11790 [Spirochaetaceae bacterium]|jgi:uncharacterized DUF497 family protein|nr:hypothetical protein [Spirochaetaceae bacterium]
MDLVITFSRSAFKHGVSKDDIRRVFALKLFDHPMEGAEEKNLLVGFDTHANLIEVLYHVVDDDTVRVFYAMPCRNTFIEMIDGEQDA